MKLTVIRLMTLINLVKKYISVRFGSTSCWLFIQIAQWNRLKIIKIQFKYFNKIAVRWSFCNRFSSINSFNNSIQVQFLFIRNSLFIHQFLIIWSSWIDSFNNSRSKFNWIRLISIFKWLDKIDSNSLITRNRFTIELIRFSINSE